MFFTEAQKKKIKIIAFDLDGTLLNGESRLSTRTEEALNSAARAGYHLVAATGRVFRALPEDLKRLSAMEYVISSNGARTVRFPGGETVMEKLIPWEALKPCLSAILDREVFLEAFTEEKGYAQRSQLDGVEDWVKDGRRCNYIRSTRLPVEDMESFIMEHKDSLENVMLLFKDLETKMKYHDYLSSFPGLNVVYSRSLSVEIGGPEASKAIAITELARRLGWGPENVLAFGDSSNDAAMLAAAGLSAAMGNAIDELKAQADIVVPPNTEDGLAQAVEELLQF